MKKFKGWACLTVAAALALLAGSRLAQGAVLDPDNVAGVR